MDRQADIVDKCYSFPCPSGKQQHGRSWYSKKLRRYCKRLNNNPIIEKYATTGEVNGGDVVKALLIGTSGAVIGTATASLVGAGLAAFGVTQAYTASQAFVIGATTSAVSGVTVRANTSILEDALNPSEFPEPDQIYRLLIPCILLLNDLIHR